MALLVKFCALGHQVQYAGAVQIRGAAGEHAGSNFDDNPLVFRHFCGTIPVVGNDLFYRKIIIKP